MFRMTYVRGVHAKDHGSYCFIRYGGRDFYAHRTNFVSGSFIELNSIVEFELGPASREDKPDQAINVRIIKRAADVLEEFRNRITTARAAELGKGGAV